MYKNIGWTLGNACPCNCKHCYSMQARVKNKDLTKEIVDKVINQIVKLGVETVNFGGNEPIFTNGLDVKKSLLPYIINELHKRNIKVGLTSSGISVMELYRNFPDEFQKLNDIDISIDSPYEEEHDNNRGNNVYKLALAALKLCQIQNIDCSIVMCAMNWNFTEDRLINLLELCRKFDTNIRINMLKPTDEKHLELMPSLDQIQEGYDLLIKSCNTLDMSDPILSAQYNNDKISGCSCGISSLRINSITPDGKIPVSPCVYMHDNRVGDLLTEDIESIIQSQEFNELKNRNHNYNNIEECSDCDKLDICRGGCSATAYWYNYHTTGTKDMYKKDPYCFLHLTKEQIAPTYVKSKSLVHQNYLCTWIGRSKI